MTMIEFTYIVMLAFGILQIILFFKIWGMTNNVKELKDLYSERSKELSSNIDKLSRTIKDLNISKSDEPQKVEKKISEIAKEPVNEVQHEAPIKELPIINEDSNEFKQHLRKWKILKEKGYTEQAIKEYMEYTQQDKKMAEEYINAL